MRAQKLIAESEDLGYNGDVRVRLAFHCPQQEMGSESTAPHTASRGGGPGVCVAVIWASGMQWGRGEVTAEGPRLHKRGYVKPRQMHFLTGFGGSQMGHFPLDISEECGIYFYFKKQDSSLGREREYRAGLQEEVEGSASSGLILSQRTVNIFRAR